MELTTIRELVEIGLDRKLDEFTLEHNFYTDLGLDSMGAIALFVELQRRTGIEISEEEAPNIQTGRQLEAFIAARLPRHA
jgi:acyl carrier protein